MATSSAQAQRDALVAIVLQHASDAECWERAEVVVRSSTLRTRLEELGVAITADVATALMATAMLLATSSEEFGGDYRDALGDLASLGLELFEG